MTDQLPDTIALVAAEELRDMTARACVITFALSPVNGFQLLALLQLATRHPALPPNSHATAAQFIDILTDWFADAPGCLELIQRGNDPDQDRPPSSFPRIIL